MTPLAWTFAALAALLGLAVLGTTAADVWLVESGRPAISEHLLALARRHPVVPCLVGVGLGLLVGLLAGHLFLPQKG